MNDFKKGGDVLVSVHYMQLLPQSPFLIFGAVQELNILYPNPYTRKQGLDTWPLPIIHQDNFRLSVRKPTKNITNN